MKKNPQSISSRLARLLAKATQSDLDSIDVEIKALEAEVAGLRALKEVLAEAVLNRPPSAEKFKKKGWEPSTRQPSMNGLDAQSRVGVFLLANGPKRSDSIKRGTGVSDFEFEDMVENTDLLEKKGTLYSLTQEGRIKFDKKHQED